MIMLWLIHDDFLQVSNGGPADAFLTNILLTMISYDIFRSTKSVDVTQDI